VGDVSSSEGLGAESRILAYRSRDIHDHTNISFP